MPLSTLQETSHDVPCKTRGQDGFATSFPVRLLHPLQHAGLSRRSPSCPSFGHDHQNVRSTEKSSGSEVSGLLSWRHESSPIPPADKHCGRIACGSHSVFSALRMCRKTQRGLRCKSCLCRSRYFFYWWSMWIASRTCV